MKRFWSICSLVVNASRDYIMLFNEDIYLLPTHQRELLDKRNKYRVIADHIASMTDRYAMKQYHELYGFMTR